jgi:hypothetical protein
MGDFLVWAVWVVLHGLRNSKGRGEAACIDIGFSHDDIGASADSTQPDSAKSLLASRLREHRLLASSGSVGGR